MDCWGKLRKKFKGFFSLPGKAPFGVMFAVTLALTSFANSMTITMPFSFLPRMMKDFGIAEKDVGYYVGMVASSLYMGRAVGSIFWGWLCDRIGSRKCVLITTNFLLVSSLFFGLSKSFSWAVTTRLIQGLVGGLIVSLKSAAFGNCDKANSPVAFGIIMSSFQCGLIVGPAIGGFLVFPAENYPSVFSKNSLFGKFPFLLPMLVTCCIFATSFILAYFYIPDSRKRQSASESTALVQGTSGTCEDESKTDDHSQMYLVNSVGLEESYLLVSGKWSHVPQKTGNKTGQKTVSYFKTNNGRCSNCCTSCCAYFKESAVFTMLRSKPVLIILFMYGLLSFMNTGFDELFPIFADSPTQYGGLGFSTSQIGTALLAAGIPLLLTTLVLAKIDQWIGTKNVAIIACCGLIFFEPLFPATGFVPASMLWYVLIPSLFVIRLFIGCSFFAVNVLMNNTVEPQFVGSVNGLGMTISCIFRTCSPTVLGSIYSWSLSNEGKFGFPFNHFFPFVVCSFVGLMANVLAASIPESLVHRIDTELEDNLPSSSLELVDSKVTQTGSAEIA